MLLAVPAAAAPDWFLLPEPKFMGHQVVFPVPGAKDTVLAPARVGEFGMEFPTVAEWVASKWDEETVRNVTRRFAAEWLGHVKAEFVRNPKKVVEYAILHSEKLPVAATVFAPEFCKQFEDVFGPKMIVVIPNRQTIFIFPGVAVNYAEYAPLILEAWRSGAAKVSLEVFELGPRGLRAIGKFEEP